MSLHNRCFAFEADFVDDLRCLPMAVRRKLDLAGVKLRLSHWHALRADERAELLAWPDHPGAIEELRLWLERRTVGLADGPARAIDPAGGFPSEPRLLPPRVRERFGRALVHRLGGSFSTRRLSASSHRPCGWNDRSLETRGERRTRRRGDDDRREDARGGVVNATNEVSR